MANRWGINGNSDRLYFLGLQNDCGWWLQPKQPGFSPTSRLKQLWEVPCHNTSGVPIGKGSQAAHPLHGWDFKDWSSGFPLIIPGLKQTDIITNLWPNCKPGFMLLLFVLSYKAWNAAKPGAWLARPPPGSQQSQDFFPILTMILQVLPLHQAVTPSYSQSGQYPRQVRSKVRGLLCFVPEI